MHTPVSMSLPMLLSSALHLYLTVSVIVTTSVAVLSLRQLLPSMLCSLLAYASASIHTIAQTPLLRDTIAQRCECNINVHVVAMYMWSQVTQLVVSAG